MVADFIDHQTKGWDREKLSRIIPAKEVQKVCKIPISLSDSKDKLIWCHSKIGGYTVKSGYEKWITTKTKTAASIPTSSFTPLSAMWKKLWNFETLPKIRLFMWKSTKNWIACRVNLVKIRCTSNSLCPICEKESETIEHLLFHCPWSRAVWFGKGKTF